MPAPPVALGAHKRSSWVNYTNSHSHTVPLTQTQSHLPTLTQMKHFLTSLNAHVLHLAAAHDRYLSAADPFVTLKVWMCGFGWVCLHEQRGGEGKRGFGVCGRSNT